MLFSGEWCRYTLEEKSHMEKRRARRKERGDGQVHVPGGVAGSRHMSPEDEAGYFGSEVFMGSLVVMQLKEEEEGRRER